MFLIRRIYLPKVTSKILLAKQSSGRKIVIIGGGTGGIGTAAQLVNLGQNQVTIIDSSKDHYFQPIWTLVGGGICDVKDSSRPMATSIPKGVQWIQDDATTIIPENNEIMLESGQRVQYNYLVVAAGIRLDWDRVHGLKEAVSQPRSGVISIYDYNYCDEARKALHTFPGGRAVFTMPPVPIKCAGAPQKIMWLFDAMAREKGIRDKCDISYWTTGESMFGIKKYSDVLEALRIQRNISGHFAKTLVGVDAQKKIAVFQSSSNKDLLEEVPFDILHVVPPMSPPNIVKNSPLADAKGWVDVDRHTLQSTKFPNVFAIGDCSNSPNSKTAAAIMAQTPVVVHNILQMISNDDKETPLNGFYNGYGSCPLIVGKNRVILAEFGYDGKILETFDSDTGKFPLSLFGQAGPLQQRVFAWMVKYFFPFVYWNLFLKGYWYGTNGPFRHDFSKQQNPRA